MKIKQTVKKNPNNDFEIAHVVVIDSLGRMGYTLLIELADWYNKEACYVEKWVVGDEKYTKSVKEGLQECYERIGSRCKEHPTKEYGWRDSEDVKWFDGWTMPEDIPQPPNHCEDWD